MATTRRRGAQLVDALHEAILAEIEDRGYANTTYDGVAARAGTSKPVLYRRWPTKAEMVLAALSAVHHVVATPPDTGSLAGDLRALLTTMRSSVENSGRRTVLALLAELESDDGSAVRDLLFARSKDVLEPLIARAVDRGELGNAPLPPAVVQLPLDLARHELLIGGTLTDDALDAIVEKITVPLATVWSNAGRAA